MYTGLLSSENPHCPGRDTVRTAVPKMPYNEYPSKTACNNEGYSCWDEATMTCYASHKYGK